MAPHEDTEKRREEQRRLEIEKLRGIEQEAGLQGIKLGNRERLKAAHHLTRAWQRANKAGLRKEDFQDAILARLKRAHESRREFRLSNWILRRGEDPTTQPHLFDLYAERTTPQKALEPYLVGLSVAAEACGADPDGWKLEMLRDLSLWSRARKISDVAPSDDRPAETLEILLKALCAELAARNRLGASFEAIRAMQCRWEMHAERLVASNGTCMSSILSPISPMCEDNLYFEEMFPFPSIPLLRVPYAVGKPDRFFLAPEAALRKIDAGHLSSGKYFDVGFPAKGGFDGRCHYNIPEDAPGLEKAPGEIFWFREIRLCIVPDGCGAFTSALESRPHLEVRFEGPLPYAGRHRVLNAYDLDLERGLFYARGEDGGFVFPNIQTEAGELWRLTIPRDPDGSFPVSAWTERDPETTGWMFDPDPVLHPGAAFNEPWNLSYTPASAPYLRHWLAQPWGLGKEPAFCPWDGRNFDREAPDSRWNRDLPAIHELNFPDFSPATWIECCLHNGLIEDALQDKIDLLKAQTGRLQADWHAARERNANALLRRWKAGTESLETKQ